MSHGGKGYLQRPQGVDDETMTNNWDAIFGVRCSFCRNRHPADEFCQAREDFRQEGELRYLADRAKRMGGDDGWRGD